MSGYAGYPYLGIRLITGGDDDEDLMTHNQALTYVTSDTSIFKVTGINRFLEDEGLSPRTVSYLASKREFPMRLVFLAHIMQCSWFAFAAGQKHLLWNTIRKRNDLHLLRFLLQHGANVEDATYPGTFSVEKFRQLEVTKYESTGHLLHDCVRTFDKSMLQVLIEHGVDVNAPNRQGDTALQTCLAVLMQYKWSPPKSFTVMTETEKLESRQDDADFRLSTVKLLIENGATVTPQVFESTTTDEYDECCAYPILFMLAAAGWTVPNNMRPAWLGENSQIIYDQLPPAFVRYASVKLRDEIVRNKFPLYQGSEGFEIVTVPCGKHLISYREPGVGWLRNDVQEEILFLADNRTLCEIAASCRKVNVQSCETLHLWTNRPLRMLKIEDWRNEFCSTKLQAPGENYFVDESILKQFCLSKGCHGWIAAARFDNDVDWAERLFEYAIFPQYVKANDNLVLTDGFVGGQGELDDAYFDNICQFQRGRFPWREARGDPDPNNRYFQLGANFLRFKNCDDSPACELRFSCTEVAVERTDEDERYRYRELGTYGVVEETWKTDLQFLEWTMLTNYQPQVERFLRDGLFHRPTEVVEMYMRFDQKWMNVNRQVRDRFWGTSDLFIRNLRMVRVKMRRAMELKQKYRQDTWPESMPYFYYDLLLALMSSRGINDTRSEFYPLLDDILRYPEMYVKRRNSRSGITDRETVTRDQIVEKVMSYAAQRPGIKETVRSIIQPYVRPKRRRDDQEKKERPVKRAKIE